MKRTFVLSVIISACFIGCGTPKSALDESSKGNEKLPSSFDPSKGTLLIEASVSEDNSKVNLSTTSSVNTGYYSNHFMNKNAKAMVDYADKNYSYKHIFVSQDDIYSKSSSYSDKSAYRWALVTSLVKSNQYNKVNSDGSTSSTHYQPIFRYYLYDRQNDITYSALSNGSSLIMWAFKQAIRKING